MQLFRTILLLFLFSLYGNAFATHNRAGEITYRYINGYTYEATITTYTKDGTVDRPSLDLNWGDGVTTTIPRNNGTGQIVGASIKKNVYISTHTFPGATTYVLSCEDPNRNADVVNIPNSVDVIFYIQSTIFINPFLGNNNSVILLNPPIDDACMSKLFVHNAGAYDPDGDSLSYELTPCLQAAGNIIPGFSNPAASTSFSINATTGDLVWDAPLAVGEYNMSFLIKEWRNRILVGITQRDMQVTVAPCPINDPPVIQAINKICIEANQNINFNVIASDINSDNVTLTATSGLFTNTNPPTFSQPTTNIGTVSSTFNWTPNCLQVRQVPYNVLFKVLDNGQPVNLADYQTVEIVVIGPETENFTSNPIGSSIQLNWNTNTCTNVVGYKIYRRNGSNPYQHDTCETGVPAYRGYQLIRTIPTATTTTYVDNNNGAGLASGTDYCYRIVACFADGAESYVSAETCNQLNRDIPIITNVSINVTSPTQGQIYIAWSKPTELNTTQFPPPFHYLIYRANGFTTNWVLIDSTLDLNDTTYIDNFLLNTTLATSTTPWTYRIEIVKAANPYFSIGYSSAASSVFVTAAPSNEQITLTWEQQVPWTNTTYTIYRWNTTTLMWDSIGTSTTPIFIDTSLVNGQEYCYKIKSIGAYSLPSIINPIINYSQEICSKPFDNIPPCIPTLQVTTDCTTKNNTLNWYIPTTSCKEDIASYKFYYTTTDDNTYETIVPFTTLDTLYTHLLGNFTAGCYVITTLDSLGNESNSSNKICVQNCIGYELPNIFTPNGDGKNDFFTPISNNSVEKIEMCIYNRWGNKVYETTNPAILWNGANCSDGVYFYIATLYENTANNTPPRTITGLITLLK